MHKRWQETYGSLWFYFIISFYGWFYSAACWVEMWKNERDRDVGNMEVSSSRSFLWFSAFNRRHVTVARWGNVHNYKVINDVCRCFSSALDIVKLSRTFWSRKRVKSSSEVCGEPFENLMHNSTVIYWSETKFNYIFIALNFNFNVLNLSWFE